MTLRKRVAIGLIHFALLVGVFYGFAGYLFYRRARPPSSAKQEAPMAGRARDLLQSAARHLERREVEQALVDYRRVLALDPAWVEAQLGLARGELATGREEIAAQEFERAIALDPANAAAKLDLARIYSHAPSTWPRAETRYREVLALRPADAQARLELARVQAWQGKAAEAIETYADPSVARRMELPDRRNLVFALIRAGRTSEAEPRARELLATHPNDWEMRLQLANLYGARRDWIRALPLYRSLVQERPGDPGVNLDYGLALVARREYAAALGPLARARNALPASQEAGLGYARALKGAPRGKDAAREFERLLPRIRNDAALRRELADLKLELRDFRSAAEHYRAAYSLGLRDARLEAGLGGALDGSGRPREALPHLEAAYARERNDRNAFALARVLHKLGRHDRALALLGTIHGSGRQRGG
jgi:tetratricopeptide (TPR) repeat protein